MRPTARPTEIALAIALASATAHATTTEQHRGLMIAGQVMRNEGKLLRARDVLTSCRDAPCDDDAAECAEIRRYCGTELAETFAQIPSIAVRVVDDRGLPVKANLHVDASVVDLVPLVELDPGHHVVRASYAGATSSVEIDLVKGRREVPVTITLDLRRTVPSRPTPWPVYLFGTVAAVASFTAIGFAIGAQKQADDLAFCKPTCDPSHEGLFTATTITVDVALVVAVVSGLASIVTYLVRPTRTHVIHVEERVGP
jgi:hypothetical protein